MTKVVLVEDDQTMRELLIALLEFEGFTPVAFDGGDPMENILDTVRNDKPAVILLDVHLRLYNGFDLLHRIRQETGLNGVRVLMTSGMDVASRSHHEGADGFIMKPYMPDDLVAKIRHLSS